MWEPYTNPLEGPAVGNVEMKRTETCSVEITKLRERDVNLRTRSQDWKQRQCHSLKSGFDAHRRLSRHVAMLTLHSEGKGLTVFSYLHRLPL